MKIYLMRHGETDYNKAKRFYGSRDIPINPQGKKQAGQLKKVMKSIVVDKVYTSSLRRTYETASIVFEDRLIVLKKMSALNEKDFGEWEGLTADQIQACYPAEWSAWLASPFEATPPQAEPFAVFQTRVWKTIDKLTAKHSQSRIAIIAHLGVLRLIYQRLVNQQVLFWDIDFPQGTVTCLEGESPQCWKSYIVKS